MAESDADGDSEAGERLLWGEAGGDGSNASSDGGGEEESLRGAVPTNSHNSRFPDIRFALSTSPRGRVAIPRCRICLVRKL